MAFKTREYLLSVDSFKKPEVLTGQQAVCMMLLHLIVLDPGSDPLHPDMGVGIRNYRYAFGRLDELKQRVHNQIMQYLPIYSDAIVNIEITDTKLCNITIDIDGDTYVYDSSEVEYPIYNKIDDAKNF